MSASITAHHGDCLEVIPRLVAEGVVCDAVVTDPPYGLEFMGKEWDTFRGSNSGIKKSGYKKLGINGTPVFDANRRNQKCPRCGRWDYDYPDRRCVCGGAKAEGRRVYCEGFQQFSEAWARIVFDVLRPGGFLVAFGGTRTYHRLACAIEDAGFVIQDTIAWLYGSGFPKRRDMLKPAWESIVIAQKPIDLRSALCGLRNSLDQMATSQFGTAAIIGLSTVSSWLDTLDALSIAESTSIIATASKTIIDWKTLNCCLSEITPESIILAHSPGHLSIASASPAIRFFDAELSKLRLTLAPSVAELAISPGLIERLDETGLGIEPIVLAYKPGGKRTMQVDECRIGTDVVSQHGRNKDDFGFCSPEPAGREWVGRWPANVCHDGSEEVTGAFAAFGERASGGGDKRGGCKFFMGGDSREDPTSHHPNSGSAARFYYCAKADAQDRWGSHPTVKPIELMKWLVPLVTPPGGLVLDPFAGSGTTGVAALATGRDCILIEREAQYIADIRERLAFYEGGGMHSVQARNRNRNAYVHQDDLFAPASEPRRSKGDLGSGWDANFVQPYDPALDSALSYEAAIKAIGERVKAGEPLPTTGYFGPKRAEDSAA